MKETPPVENEKALFFMRSFIMKKTGMDAGSLKDYLMQSRLSPLVKKYQCVDLQDLAHKAQVDKSIEEEIIDQITTHESYFFRNLDCFETFTTHIFPVLEKRMKRGEQINILSAGCAYGQEAYSLAMILQSLLCTKLQKHARIYACDISKKAIEKAQKGLYSDLDLDRGEIPSKYLHFFQKQDKLWQVSPEIQNLTQFFPHNILENMPASIPKFDLIFCRHLYIYLSGQGRSCLIEKKLSILKQNSFLIMGVGEMLSIDQKQFELIQHDSPSYPFYINKSSTL